MFLARKIYKFLKYFCLFVLAAIQIRIAGAQNWLAFAAPPPQNFANPLPYASFAYGRSLQPFVQSVPHYGNGLGRPTTNYGSPRSFQIGAQLPYGSNIQSLIQQGLPYGSNNRGLPYGSNNRGLPYGSNNRGLPPYSNGNSNGIERYVQIPSPYGSRMLPLNAANSNAFASKYGGPNNGAYGQLATMNSMYGSRYPFNGNNNGYGNNVIDNYGAPNPQNSSKNMNAGPIPNYGGQGGYGAANNQLLPPTGQLPYAQGLIPANYGSGQMGQQNGNSNQGSTNYGTSNYPYPNPFDSNNNNNNNNINNNNNRFAGYGNGNGNGQFPLNNFNTMPNNLNAMPEYGNGPSGAYGNPNRPQNAQYPLNGGGTLVAPFDDPFSSSSLFSGAMGTIFDGNEQLPFLHDAPITKRSRRSSTVTHSVLRAHGVSTVVPEEHRNSAAKPTKITKVRDEAIPIDDYTPELTLSLPIVSFAVPDLPEIGDDEFRRDENSATERANSTTNANSTIDNSPNDIEQSAHSTSIQPIGDANSTTANSPTRVHRKGAKPKCELKKNSAEESYFVALQFVCA